MNLVVLDGHTVNPGDLDWSRIEVLGNLQVHDRTPSADIVDRSQEAQILIVNKVRIDAEIFAALPNLKAIFLLATGYDNINIDSARAKGVAVYNAVGYGAESVAQHTISLMLAHVNGVIRHHHSVMKGDWSDQDDFSYTLGTVHELKGQTLGLLGFGKIGSRVAVLARAFGMDILVHSRSKPQVEDIEFVDRESLFARSDFLSLHVPLSPDTREIINERSLSIMKNQVVLINTGRGGLVNERDLARALYEKRIAGAAVDVLSLEPPRASNPLLSARNCIITPHMAWSSKEARRRLIETVADNIVHFQNNRPVNRVV
ncbi:MAG: D-2-hydroxyacid dehydrogenase [Saprospiraceae bacterium]|nr:D-2-hydroxyacid dehydrogenase [Saprospiraceae bacterium]